jgi:ParB-like chromosome segregation protein Spo0J
MKVALTKLKNNPKNPRVIRDEKFNKLKKSIEDFPDMLEKRPLVVFTDKDGKFVVLGGNMRLKAAKELGIKELPVIVADEWTEEQKAQFLIKDNVNFGEWNHEELANEWDAIQLQEWGLDLPVNLETEDIDYSILDEDDLGDKLQEMQDGVKKAIQIEFEAEHYEEAYGLVKFWREQGAYVGKMIMDYLQSEKAKL